MYISQINLRRDLSVRETGELTKGNGYRIHKMVWDIFSHHRDQNRNFLYRKDAGNSQLSFHTVSDALPQDAGNYWDIISKPYNPQLRAGQRLRFSCSVNPIVSKRDDQGRQHRHDVVMNARKHLEDSGMVFDIKSLVQEHVGAWLARKGAALGFEIDLGFVKVDGYQQHRLYKSRGNQPIKFSSADIEGILTVVDANVFVTNCLYAGIGPAKGFGCGLMLVKKI